MSVIDDVMQQVATGQPVDWQRASDLLTLEAAVEAQRFVEHQHRVDTQADNAMAILGGVDPTSVDWRDIHASARRTD